MTEPSIDAENGTEPTRFGPQRRCSTSCNASLTTTARPWRSWRASSITRRVRSHRHLHTLEELGYVVHRDDGYHVGLRFLEVGVTARSSYRGYDLVRRKVEEIAEVTGERAQFFVEEHGKVVYLSPAVGNQAVRTDPGIGSRIPCTRRRPGKQSRGAAGAGTVRYVRTHVVRSGNGARSPTRRSFARKSKRGGSGDTTSTGRSRSAGLTPSASRSAARTAT